MRRLIATAERSRKQRDVSRDELRTLWASQFTPEERQTLSRLCQQSAQSPTNDRRISVAEAVQWAEEHLFDRNSVVLECQVWQEALNRARGEEFLGFATDGVHAATGLHPERRTSGRSDVARRSAARTRDCSNGQGRCRRLVAARWRILAHRIHNSMMNNAGRWICCFARPTRCRFSAAAPAPARVLCFGNWSSKSVNQTGQWSSSPLNASRSWTWRKRDSLAGDRDAVSPQA